MRYHSTRSLTWRGEPFQFERLHVRDSSDEPTEWAVSRRGEFIGTMVCGLEVTPKIFDRVPTMGMSRLVSGLNFVKYAAVFAGYFVIFIIAFMTVGFLEIRQANMEDFNALIAVLEQRDGYADSHLDKALWLR